MLVFNSCGAAPLHVSRCRLSCLPELHIRMYAIEWKCMFQFCENDYNFHQLIYMFIKNTMKPPQITQHFFCFIFDARSIIAARTVIIMLFIRFCLHQSECEIWDAHINRMTVPCLLHIRQISEADFFLLNDFNEEEQQSKICPEFFTAKFYFWARTPFRVATYVHCVFMCISSVTSNMNNAPLCGVIRILFEQT